MSLRRPPPDPQDRLAALLERASAQRTAGAAEPVDPAPVVGPGQDAPGQDVPGEADESVTGGGWVPPDPAARHRPEPAERPRLLTLPTALRSVDLSVRPVAVVGVVLLVLVAVTVFGVRWWQSERAAEPVALSQITSGQAAGHGAPGVPDDSAARDGPDVAEVTAPPGEASQGGADAAAGPTAPEGPVVVHVAGAVQHPGVVQLPAGSRVQDAVDAAGGLTGQADTARVNLARPVLDGERIWVPHPGEEIPELPPDPGPAAPSAGGGAAGAEPGTEDGTGQEPVVSLNTADRQGLESLPGVGPVTAGAILDWRTEHGRFTSVEELLEISGIGEATLEKLRPRVRL